MQKSYWDFEETTEVTNEIFSLYGYHLLGKTYNETPWLVSCKKSIKNFFAIENPTYKNWCDSNGIGLVTFAVLVKEFGWDAFRTFFKQYEDEVKSGVTFSKKSSEVIDRWVIRFSKIVQRNIKPHFVLFGLPVSDKVDEHVNHFEPFTSEKYKDPEELFA